MKVQCHNNIQEIMFSTRTLSTLQALTWSLQWLLWFPFETHQLKDHILDFSLTFLQFSCVCFHVQVCDLHVETKKQTGMLSTANPFFRQSLSLAWNAPCPHLPPHRSEDLITPSSGDQTLVPCKSSALPSELPPSSSFSHLDSAFSFLSWPSPFFSVVHCGSTGLRWILLIS